MGLQLSAERKDRVERRLEAGVIVAALATIPLTYAHLQQWDGAWLVAADWLIWAVFAAELSFHLAISAQRWRTLRQHWFHAGIVVLSFPVLPHLLGLTRLARLLRPLRLAGGLRIARPLQLVRLYAVRSAGGRVAVKRAKEAGHVDTLRERAGEAERRAGSLLRERGEEENERD